MLILLLNIYILFSTRIWNRMSKGGRNIGSSTTNSEARMTVAWASNLDQVPITLKLINPRRVIIRAKSLSAATPCSRMANSSTWAASKELEVFLRLITRILDPANILHRRISSGPLENRPCELRSSRCSSLAPSNSKWSISTLTVLRRMPLSRPWIRGLAPRRWPTSNPNTA